MKLKVKYELSVMMFLQFFIWGGWFVTLSTFLSNNFNAEGSQIALAYSTQSWGAILAPFIIGLIADRFFNAERILGILHLAGAVLMFMMANSTHFEEFYPYVLIYMILYMPTLALVNSVSFGQMKDPSKDFSKIRLWGTVGWVIAGLLISYVFLWDAPNAIDSGSLKNTFLMCAVASFILGVFSFFLPATPPKINKNEKISIRDILGIEALKLLKDKNFVIFFISSISICIPLAFYYQYTNPFLVELKIPEPTGKMTIGQGSEVLFMLLLPVFLRKFGIKLTLMAGMLAWAIRYVLFAFGSQGELTFIILIGIALHGICYDFFFVSGQIFTDAKAGEKYKSAAQGLITLATYGVGMIIGFEVAGYIVDSYKISKNVYDWNSIWLFPSGFAIAALFLFLLFFKNEKIKTKI